MNLDEKTLIYINHHQLLLHPRNIRQYYPPDDVAEMAESIRASGGVWQALLIVPAEAPDTYYVVDGNMRLAGARTLGDNCPPLKCEVIDAGAAEQLLIMAATSKYHYPKDPISEALHLKRLREEEGFTVERLCELTGFSNSYILNRARLLELDEDIQALIMKGELGPDPAIFRYLPRIPDKVKRVELARRFARNKTSSKQMVISVNYVLHQMEALGQTPPPHGHQTHLERPPKWRCRKAKKGRSCRAGNPGPKDTGAGRSDTVRGLPARWPGPEVLDLSRPLRIGPEPC